VNKQKKILMHLNYTAIVVCMFFVFYLQAIQLYAHLWIFVLATAIFIFNTTLLKKKGYSNSFLIFTLTINFLLLVFDDGISSPLKLYVFYFPLLLSVFLLTRYDQKIMRWSITIFTLFCFLFINFTTLTPRFGSSIYNTNYVEITSIIIIIISFFASMNILMIMKDVYQTSEDELIKTKEKITEAEERWSYALSNNQEGVWDYDIASGTVYYSPQWKKMLGYNEYDIADKKSEWDRLVHPDDIDMANLAVQKNLSGETTYYEQMFRMLCKNGSYKWIYAKGKVCEFDEDGKAKRFIGTHTDITEQKLAQGALIQSQQLLNSINQNIDVAICRTSKSMNKLVYVNRGYIKLFGYDNEQDALNSGPANIYFNKSDRDKILKTLEEKGSISNIEIQYLKKDGTVFWALLSSSSVVDENGNISYDGAMRDITILKEIEAELIKAKEIAEKASVAKSQFLSTMSHEIRTPMNAVIGISNLLMQENPKPDQIENLSVLKFSAENLLTLINNILDFSKIEAGKIEFEELPVNIDQLIRSIIQSNIIEAKQKDVQIILTSSINGNFLTDPTRISQILNNLISNAIKFTEKGNIKVSVDLVDYSVKDSTLKFTIKDTGIGIDEDKIPLIFESFSQENKDISRRFGGTGLGLAITKLLLDLMKSKIEVTSIKGKGSTFTFILTLKKAMAHGAKIIKSEEQNLNGMMVLLVEDNQMNVMLISKFLKRWEINIDVVNNGYDAITKMQENKYNLVLMDLHMPELNGYDATIAIRKFDTETPIFALTADAFADTRTRAMESGMDDFISKPFNPDELYNKMARLHFKSSIS
jgi:PAS domain S-box-containing protein